MKCFEQKEKRLTIVSVVIRKHGKGLIEIYINKNLCPVCGSKNISIIKKFMSCRIRCNYCCHHSSGITKRKALKRFWHKAVNAEFFAMENG